MNSKIIIIAITFMSLQGNIFAQSPYEISWQNDGVLIAVGIPLIAIGYTLDRSITPLTLAEVNNLDRENIPKIGRFVSYNYSESASDLSDILLYTCLASPILLLSSSAVRRDFGTVYGMYAEVLFFGIGLPFCGKSGAQRIRPYAYNPDTPMDKKLTAESKRSFFSGHSSAAFSSTIFLSSVYSTYYPNSKWKPYILTGSVLLASTVGYLRIAAGAHFLTDVLVGAIVGASIGYIIPKIHETGNKNVVFESPDIPTRPSGVSFQFSL